MSAPHPPYLQRALADPLSGHIFQDLVDRGRAAELTHPHASPYWTGTENDITFDGPLTKSEAEQLRGILEDDQMFRAEALA